MASNMSEFPHAQSTLAATSSLTGNAFILQNLLTSRPARSLSAIAKALTRFLFDRLPLPEYLEDYGHLLSLTTSGALGVTLYHLFHKYRENRAKVQLATFHVIRMTETRSDMEALLDDPHALIQVMDSEVAHMIDIHLTKNEASEAMTGLKRKVWSYVDEQRASKRQETSSTEYQASIHGYEEEQHLQTADDHDVIELSSSSPTPSEVDVQDQLQDDTDEQHLDIMDMDSHSSVPVPSSSQTPSPPTSSSAKQPSSEHGRSTYLVPSSSESDEGHSPTLGARAPKNTPQHGYGLNYDEEDEDNEELYTAGLPSSPPKTSQARQQQKTIAKKPMSMLQAATIRAFDLEAPGNRPYESPVLSGPKAVKPITNVKLQEPPNTLANKTRDPKRGTWLELIPEGFSPHQTPPSSTTQYRVAESRKYYDDVKSARKERRSVRDFFKPGEELVQVRQEQAHSPTPVVVKEQVEQEWPDAILTYSDGEDDDDAEVVEPVPRMSPLPSMDSPPSAPEISPPLPSLSSDSSISQEFSSELPQIPSSPLSSPLSDRLSSPPLSEVETLQQASPPVSSTPRAVRSKTPLKAPQTPIPVRSSTPKRSSPIVLIETPPKTTTPSPPKKTCSRPRKAEDSVKPDTPMPVLKKLGRIKKVVGEIQTPCKVRVETPGVRKSARKSGYRGAYTK